MAAVDASVGIKTAVNFNNRKNKMGTYCPPLAVFLDRSYLRTLDQRNLSNGAAEMLKMVLISHFAK
jgi:3-dehydroquinate synthetase